MVGKANAWVPVVDGDRVVYSDTVEKMKPNTHLAMDAGPRIIGGCCGNTPAPHRHLEICLAHPRYSDLAWAARGVGGVLAAYAIAMSEIDHDTTVDGPAARPTRMSVNNVNSPRRVDDDILDDIMRHSYLINQATGWLGGSLFASFERAILDSEMLRAWAAMREPISFTDNGLAVEAILSTSQGGHFFGSPHTTSRYEHASWRPLLTDWSNFENCRVAGAKDANIRVAEVWARTLSSAESLALAPAIDEALGAYVVARKNEIGA